MSWRASTICDGFSSQASRTAATSSSPFPRHRLLSRRAPSRRSPPDIISSAASAACESRSPRPGWNSHQRACHAAAAGSKQSGFRLRSPRQTSMPCFREPRRTALGSGTQGCELCGSPSIAISPFGCFNTNCASRKAPLIWVQSAIAQQLRHATPESAQGCIVVPMGGPPSDGEDRVVPSQQGGP